jgi:hypothetical protein
MLTKGILASQSAAADLNSLTLDLGDITTYAIQVSFTAIPASIVGTLKLQASVDSVYWADITGSPQAVNKVTADAPYSHTWSGPSEGYRYVRVNWDYTSGGATFEMTAFLKQHISP